MLTINIVAAFHMSLDNLETGTKRTERVRRDPRCLRALSPLRRLLGRSRCPAIFPRLPAPVSLPRSPGAFLRWPAYFNVTAASLKKIYSARVRFLLPRSLSHVELWLTFIPPSAAVYHISPNSHLFCFGLIFF